MLILQACGAIYRRRGAIKWHSGLDAMTYGGENGRGDEGVAGDESGAGAEARDGSYGDAELLDSGSLDSCRGHSGTYHCVRCGDILP